MKDGPSTNGRSSAFGALCLGSNPSGPARLIAEIARDRRHRRHRRDRESDSEFLKLQDDRESQRPAVESAKQETLRGHNLGEPNGERRIART